MILPCGYFQFKSIRISLIGKVTRIDKAMIEVNDTSLYGTILVLFLEHRPGYRAQLNFPYEQTTKFVPLNEPAR